MGTSSMHIKAMMTTKCVLPFDFSDWCFSACLYVLLDDFILVPVKKLCRIDYHFWGLDGRFGLGDKRPSIPRVIVGPPVYLRNFTGPVAMRRMYGRCPLQGGCLPGILHCHFPAFENGI